MVDGGLITTTDFIDMVAISQSTPGPIGINMATYTGFKLASVPGGVIATAGIVTPSLIIIILIAALMKNFASNRVVRNSLEGIRPAALGLIASAVWFILSKAVLITPNTAETSSFIDHIQVPGLIILAGVLIACSIKRMTPIVYILISAAAGIILF